MRDVDREETNFRILFDAIPNPSLLVDRKTGRIVLANRAASHLFGYTAEEWNRIGYVDLQAPDEGPASIELLRQSAPSGPYFHRSRGKDGSVIETRVRALDQFFEGRSCRALLLVPRRSEPAGQSQNALALAQSTARVGCFELYLPDDRSSAVDRWWSDEMCRILGLPPGWTSTEHPANLKFVHPDDEPMLAKARDALIERGEPYEIEHRVIRADGAIRYVRSTGRAGESGGRRRYVGTVQDITEYHAMREQLRQTQRLDGIGRLAGAVAHDFNNLLTVINGYSKHLLGKLPPGDAIREEIEQIADAGREAAELTNRLLAFGRKQVLKPVILDLNQVLRGSRTFLGRLLGPRIRMETLCGAGEALVWMDAVQLNEILLNLAANARDAMPDGGWLRLETDSVTSEVSIHPQAKPGRYVHLTVADNGCGMDRETRKRIFEPFFTTRERCGGSGLGLASVYGIVQQSGGWIECWSEPGKGARFDIHLPAPEPVNSLFDAAHEGREFADDSPSGLPRDGIRRDMPIPADARFSQEANRNRPRDPHGTPPHPAPIPSFACDSEEETSGCAS
jgi:PAS domain S-box-containing protein